jgi:hypothetical protein
LSDRTARMTTPRIIPIATIIVGTSSFGFEKMFFSPAGITIIIHTRAFPNSEVHFSKSLRCIVDIC